MKKNVKRTLALAAIFLLLSLYVITFITAFISSPAYAGFFKASLYCTVFIPIAIYAYLLVYRSFQNRKKDNTKEEKH